MTDELTINYIPVSEEEISAGIPYIELKLQDGRIIKCKYFNGNGAVGGGGIGTDKEKQNDR